MSTERYLFCLYSDDIRYEINGKVSLIGMYQGGMNVAGALPAILPKLVISTYINTPVDKPFSDLRVDVLLNDEVLQSVAPPADALLDMQKSFTQDSGIKQLTMQMVFVLQPFEIKANGVLKMLAHADGESLNSNALKITIIEDSSTLSSGDALGSPSVLSAP